MHRAEVSTDCLSSFESVKDGVRIGLLVEEDADVNLTLIELLDRCRDLLYDHKDCSLGQTRLFILSLE